MALNDAATKQPPAAANPFLVVFLVSTLVMIPALLAGAMRHGVDSIFHARWMRSFSQQFWSGEFYPRWLMDLNDGFGSPAFFIYPPFSQFVTAILYPLLSDPSAAAMLLGISAWLAVVISGIACFLWLRKALPGWHSAALIGALTYMLAPYHLYIDVYQRGAMAEVWAFVWPPISLLLVHRLDRFQPGTMALLALSLTGLLVTHAPSVLILFPTYFLYAVVLDWQDRRISRSAWLAVGCGLGCLLAGRYLGTALMHTQYINTEALFGPRTTSSNWLIGGGAWDDPAIQHAIYIAVTIQGLIGLAAASVALAKSRRGERALPLLALLLSIIPLFMMTVPSKPIWDLGLPINRIQFPWRFSLLLSLACALAVALAARRLAPIFMTSVPALFLIANALLYAFPAEHPLAATVVPSEISDDRNWDAGEYRLARKDEIDGEFAEGQRARFASGTGSLAVVEWRPRAIRLDVDAATRSTVAVRQFVYPGWTVSASPSTAAATLLEGEPYLMIAMPAGRHAIELVLSETTEEYVGRIASGIGLIIVLCLASLSITRWRVNPRSAGPRIPA